jgi:hypothetical protein
MTEDPFLQERHAKSGRTATFDDSGNAAWLHPTVPDSQTITPDEWVYNRVAPPT